MHLLAAPSFKQISPLLRAPFMGILELPLLRELHLPHPNVLFSEHGQGGVASGEQSFPRTSE